MIEVCPRPDCDERLTYVKHGDAACAAGHGYRHYAACNGLLPIDPKTFQATGPMYVSESEVVRVLDLGAQIWNALVWYSHDRARFWKRLFNIAVQLRDQSHATDKAEGRFNGFTQMDYEVEAMKHDGAHLGNEGS